MNDVDAEQQAVAAAAANPSASTDRLAAATEYLVFQGRAALLAIAADQIVEIAPRAVISRLPWPPRYVAGVCAVRGRVIPVLNLDDAIRGDMLRVETMALPRMVIAQFDELEFGLLAEHTFGLYSLRSDELTPTQGTLYSARTTWRGAALHVISAEAICAAVRLPA